MKTVYRDKKASVHWSAAKNKERFSPRGLTARHPLVNREFVPTFGLHRILLVRAFGETFMQYFFDALEGTRVACFLGELFCRRPVLIDSIPSPRRALRPDAPVICSGFGIDISIF